MKTILTASDKLKIRFNAKPTSDNMKLIFCIISYGYKYITAIDKHKYSFIAHDEYDQQDVYINVNVPKHYKPVSVSTGLSLPAKFWKDNKATGIYKHYNDQLKQFETNIRMLFQSIAQTGKEIKPEYLKQIITKHIVNNKGEQKTFHINLRNEVGSVPTIFTDYIDHKSKGEHIRVKTFIERYENEKMTGEKIDLLTITDNLIKDMFSFFSKLEIVTETTDKETGESITKKRPYKLNYIGLLRKEVKKFINEAKNEDDINVQVNTKKKTFKKAKGVTWEEIDDIYCSLKQIRQIEKLEFDDDEKMLERVRDMFVVNCFLGLRFSDLKRLNKIEMDTDGKHYIQNTNQKTGAKVKIPIFDKVVLNVYKKYGNSFPTMSEKTFNEFSKMLFIRTKQTQIIERNTRHPNTGDMITTSVPFWKLVSSKSCRKTFASNLVREFNVPIQIATHYTGHTSERQFRTYIRMQDDEFYNIMAKQLNEYQSKLVRL